MSKNFWRSKIKFLIPLVILSLLLAVTIRALNAAREVANRSSCAVNLEIIGSALDIYTATFHAAASPPAANGKNLQWLSDEPQSFAMELKSTFAPESVNSSRGFYCPSNSAQNPDTLANWNTISVMGYALFNDRGPNATNMPQTFPGRTPPIQYATRLVATSDPTESELAADWIISDSPDTRTTASFTSVARSAPGSPTLSFPTSHLTGNKPAGANVLAFDSHVAWRPFNPKTATPIQQPGSAPVYFWLPAP